MAVPHDAAGAGAEINVVACESCRTKKCRCDRRLPICSQCVASGLQCNYPESNKRGFPPGYIAALERRLLETEIALFDALKELQLWVRSSSHHDERASDDGGGVGAGWTTATRDPKFHSLVVRSLTSQSAGQSKSEKIAEWDILPLTTREQHLEWWHQRLSSTGPAGEALLQRLNSSQSPQSAGVSAMTGPGPSRRSPFMPHELGQHAQIGSYLSPTVSNDGSLPPDNPVMMMPPPPRPGFVSWPSSHPDAMGYSIQTSPGAQQGSPGETTPGGSQINMQYAWSEPVSQTQSDSGMNMIQVRGGSGSPTAAYGTGTNSTAQRLSSAQWRKYF